MKKDMRSNKKVVLKRNLVLSLALVGLVTSGILVHKHVFATTRLNALKEKCDNSESFPVSITWYDNGLITVFPKKMVFDGGFAVYDSYGRFLYNGATLQNFKSPWYWLRKWTGRQVEFDRSVPGHDFCTTIENNKEIDGLKTEIPVGWRQARIDLYSGEVVDEDTSKHYGVVQEGKEPQGNVAEKEIPSYVIFEEWVENRGDYSNVEEWIKDSLRDDPLFAASLSRVETANKLFENKGATLVGSVFLEKEWVEISPNNYVQGERKGEYVRFASIIDGHAVLAAAYINPADPKVEEIIKILNSVVNLNKK